MSRICPYVLFIYVYLCEYIFKTNECTYLCDCKCNCTGMHIFAITRLKCIYAVLQTICLWMIIERNISHFYYIMLSRNNLHATFKKLSSVTHLTCSKVASEGSSVERCAFELSNCIGISSSVCKELDGVSVTAT